MRYDFGQHRWRMTKTGKVAHAVKRGAIGVCGTRGWSRATVAPGTKQHVRTFYCQRCVGRLVRAHQIRKTA
jgi:hypothetical protein